MAVHRSQSDLCVGFAAAVGVQHEPLEFSGNAINIPVGRGGQQLPIDFIFLFAPS